jgi:hypothetical protein
MKNYIIEQPILGRDRLFCFSAQGNRLNHIKFCFIALLHQ